MARRARIEQARQRLRALRRSQASPPEPSSPERESEPEAPEPEPEATEPAPEPEPAEPGPEPELTVEAELAPEFGQRSGSAPVSLGDLSEGRRESLSARLRALRERRPTRPRLRRTRRPSTAPGPGWRSRASGAGVGAGKATRELAFRAARGVAATGGALTGAAHRTSLAWKRVPLLARQRIAAGAIVVALAAIVWLVLIPAAPCGAPGGDDCPPTDDAIALLPADALAYAHVDIDAEGDQFPAAAALLRRLPLFSNVLAGAIADAGGVPVDFATQVSPWAGGEAALAILPGGVGPERVAMIKAEDSDGARDFAAGMLGATASSMDVDGVEVSVGSEGSAAALVGGFLLLGDVDGVSQIIDPGGDGGTLETSAAASALDDLPEDRVAYAYVSGEGARALLRNPGAASLDTFLDSDATAGIAAALSVEGDVASLTVRSRLDPDRVQDSPGFFSALPPFAPGLTADVGPDALAYLGLGDPAGSVDSLLSQAAIGAPGLLRAYGQATETLRREGGISVVDDLLPLLGSEAALSVEPVAGAVSTQAPGVLAPAGVPYVSLIADGIEGAAAAAALADLQQPIVSALVPGGGDVAGRVPVFEPLQIAGIEAQSVTVSPNVQLTYATYDDRLAVATDPLGIAQARAAGDGLAESAAFGEVADTMPEEVSLLAYLDLEDLIALGEQVGLAADPAYATLAPDLRVLDAAAIAVDTRDGVIRTDLNVALGEADTARVDPPPLAGE